MSETQNRILNWKRQPKDPRDFKSTRHLASPIQLPTAFELDKIPVYDQLQAGSCVGNGCCESFRLEAFQLTGNYDFDPSRLFVYWNARNEDGSTNEDAGTYIRSGFKAMNKYGLCHEKLHPYDDALSSVIKKPSSEAYTDGLKNITVQYAAVNQNEQEIKATLVSGAAVVFGFTVYNSFFGSWANSTGIMPLPKKNETVAGGHCFTKDTKVSLLDGREVSFEYLVENYSDKEFYVYSYDLVKNKIVPGKAHHPRKTGEQREILKITLDNGEEIKCTKNHPFLLKSGIYKNAEELEIGQSLMPLYRKKDDRGYEMILDGEKWVYTHRAMVDWTQTVDRTKRLVVHHVDFKKENNEPTNLQLMTWDDHTELHAASGKLLTEYAQSEKGRQKSRELMTALWTDPEWRANRINQNGINGKKLCELRSLEGKNGFQNWDPEEHSRISRENGLKNCHTMHTPEAIEKSAETRRLRLETDSEYAEKMKDVAIQNINSYNEAIKNGTIQLTEEQKEKKRQTARENIKKTSPEKRLLAQRKTTFTRFYKDQYDSFEEFMTDQYPVNHKITNIEFYGIEDVYDLSVDKYENFALSSGVFVHNCVIVVGYDDSKKCFKCQNSWGVSWGLGGYFWMPYSFLLDPNQADDFWAIQSIKLDNGSIPVPPKPSEIDWVAVSGILFKTAAELYAVKKPTILRLGTVLGLTMDPKQKFAYNYNLVKEKLGL